MKLIDKDALVTEIQKLRAKNKVSIFNKIPFKPNYEMGQKTGAYGTLGLLLDTIDTLEVKEVDLEKELQSFFYPHVPWGDYCKNEQEDLKEWSFKIAKHFFELGLKNYRKENKS